MSIPVPSIADRIRFVLVRTSHPGNIGGAARAIRTMGLRRLSLVAPHAFPHAEANALAAGADDVLAAAPVARDLPEAIADCALVIGTTARRRDVPMEEIDPREAAARVVAAARAGNEVALVFGNERTGLENEEIKRCRAAVLIPSDPDFPSLNLAQAVQVLAYEIRMAELAGVSPLPVQKHDPPASSAELDAFFDHLAKTLDAIDFHKGRSPRTVLLRLRRLYLRAAPDRRELRILHGILSDTDRLASLLRGKTTG
ncbi:MAG TPA: RNA methyltransferase [Rhodanobacteraceae bacterium]|nr:RNA methyltransferase [Rhodanobacteraceae bacterium]